MTSRSRRSEEIGDSPSRPKEIALGACPKIRAGGALRNDRAGGFVLFAALVLLGGVLLSISALLSGSTRALTAVRLVTSISQLNAAIDSGLDYAETELRSRDFGELLTGANGAPDTTVQAARQIAFRNPLSRMAVLGRQWSDIALEGNDDGFLHASGVLLHPSGLELNGAKLFFKVTNNREDAGGPFEDRDDIVLLRALAVAPVPGALRSAGMAQNMCQIAEIALRRPSAFLGPAAIYAPSGQLDIDLRGGGTILGRAEIGTGIAVGFGSEGATVELASAAQVDGAPAIKDLAAQIASDERLHWLTQTNFVEHWKSRIASYAGPPLRESLGGSIQWAPEGIELQGTETLQGVIFAAGPVVARDSARIEGLLVLVDSGSLAMFDTASLGGMITTVGQNRSFSIRLHDGAEIAFRPAAAANALRLLPLSRVRFRYITPEMEPF